MLAETMLADYAHGLHGYVGARARLARARSRFRFVRKITSKRETLPPSFLLLGRDPGGYRSVLDHVGVRGSASFYVRAFGDGVTTSARVNQWF